MLNLSSEQEESYRNIDQYSCLFLSRFKLLRVPCPFTVTCKVASSDFTIGEQVEVSQVIGWQERVLLFRVSGKLYPHSFFFYNPPQYLTITRLT